MKETNITTSIDTKKEKFLKSKEDTFAILQLVYSDKSAFARFSSIKTLEKLKMRPDPELYEVKYVAPLEPYEDLGQMLESLFTRFNINRPEDFTGHSMSVSDVVGLNENGCISYYFVDSYGFQNLRDFKL